MSTIADKRIATLTAAAKARSDKKTKAAEQAIRTLVKRGEPITFQAVRREARVSHAFLYNHPELRHRIEHLRSQARPATTAAQSDPADTVVLALTSQIDKLKKQHRQEVQALRAALERAHGENLDLRRELARRGGAPTLGQMRPAHADPSHRQYIPSRRSTIRRSSLELRSDIAVMTNSRRSLASHGDPQHSKIPQPPSR